MSKPQTIRKAQLGKTELRLRSGDQVVGMADGKLICQGRGEDEVWAQLYADVLKSRPNYFGYDGARNRFLHFFRDGFASSKYASHEREYKLASKRKLDAIATPNEAASASGLGEKIWSVFQSNMLSPFEKMRVRDVLMGPKSDAFIQSVARFTLDGGQRALRDMEHVLRPIEAAKWTVVTFLPFLWRPEQHMYLKPEVTKLYAERVGHPYAEKYSPDLDIAVYESLLDLSRLTEMELVDLKPRDRIDIQSFIWVIGKYDGEPSRE
ncbi:hypothetical protein [Sinorhizobium fredii]|uniref:hypothetical protein n=1 Tax=Rhizobium fredii TaxID=380 RepID=UPI0005667C68|nr:hypothetical protein [Sinorhizobium fredii]